MHPPLHGRLKPLFPLTDGERFPFGHSLDTTAYNEEKCPFWMKHGGMDLNNRFSSHQRQNGDLWQYAVYVEGAATADGVFLPAAGRRYPVPCGQECLRDWIWPKTDHTHFHGSVSDAASKRPALSRKTAGPRRDSGAFQSDPRNDESIINLKISGGNIKWKRERRNKQSSLSE